jgi:RNA polymerase sigma-70 factor, ECF subfamily
MTGKQAPSPDTRSTNRSGEFVITWPHHNRMVPMSSLSLAKGTSAQLTIPRERPSRAVVAAAANGDVASFEILVRRYKRTVLAIGRRMTRSLDDAEDIAQQTFMKAFLNLSMFRGECAFSTWLLSIATNEARMWIRKQYRHRELPAFPGNIDDDEAYLIDVPDLRPDPESLYREKERDTLLSAKLNQLRPATRRALELCDLQERSTDGAALLLGITVSALKSRRSRGRQLLRGKLAPHLSSLELHHRARAKDSHFIP